MTTQEDKKTRLRGARPILMTLMAIVAMVSLAACGDSAAQPTATATATTAPPAATVPASSDVASPSDAGTVAEVKATLREWAIDLSQAEVPAGKVKFIVTNQGQMQHNFTVTNSSGTVGATPSFSGSQGAQTLEVDLQPGTYTLICSLPGHASRGQKIELVVK